MALSYLRAKSSILPPLFSPLLTALFSRIPLWQRWRTLFLQPLSLLAAALTSPSWLFSNQYEVLYIPTRGGRHIRCLVFQPPRETTVKKSRNATAQESESENKTDLRPLHIDIHGGGFIGGLPEHNARFCAFVAARTAAVVVSLSYRLAPAHTYPAAHDDVDDAVAWLVAHAEERLGADPALVTLGGSSAGGNLALSAAAGMGMAREGTGDQAAQQHQKQVEQTQMVPRPLACLAFYPVLDLRLRAEHKSQPPGFVDPFAFLMPLYDVYGGTERGRLLGEARLHVTLTERRVLPGRMLVVVAEIDILREEQMGMVERLERERESGEGGEVEVEVEVIDVKGGFHGFLELPSFVLEKERMMVFERSVEVIREVHRKNGFDLGKID